MREARRRIKTLEQENEVLRRAAAYLSQANLPGSPGGMTLLCLESSGDAGLKLAEDGAADVALQAAADLAVASAFGPPAAEVGAGGGVVAHAAADGDVEGAVELPVA